MRAIHQLMTRELFGGSQPLVDLAAGDEVTLSCIELALP